MSFLEQVAANLRAGLRPGVRPDDSPSRRLRRNFVFHLHPLRVTERALQLKTTLALGIVALALLGLLTLSGLMLMLYYVPTPGRAYDSMLDVIHVVSFGKALRLVHRFAAHAMVAVVALHLIRVWAMAAYRQRELNWLIGLTLGALLLGLAFTGYLLPWDQTSYWAIRVVANMLDFVPLLGLATKKILLGGSDVGDAALVRFYAVHVAILPAAMAALVALHLWRIRRDGGLCRQPDEEVSTVSAWPHLVLREAIVVLVVVAAVLLFALVVDSPLGPPADTSRPDNPEKAPWYFLGVQEMVSYSATLGGVVYPLAMLLILLMLPYVDRQRDGIGYWLGRAQERRLVVGIVVLSTVATVAAVTAHLHLATASWIALVPLWVQDIVNPAAAMLALAVFSGLWVGVAFGKVRPAARAAFATLVVALVVFTLIGLCRGPDWQFYWPWQEWPGGA